MNLGHFFPDEDPEGMFSTEPSERFTYPAPKEGADGSIVYLPGAYLGNAPPPRKSLPREAVDLSGASVKMPPAVSVQVTQENPWPLAYPGYIWIRPSSIETIGDGPDSGDGCYRKVMWAQRGFPSESSEAQRFGTAGHSVVEHYLKTGEPIDTSTHLGRTMAAGHPFLPLPHPAGGLVKTEVPIRVPVTSEWGYQGTTDLTDGVAFVGDHKTTKSFTYALSQDALKANGQFLVYSSPLRPGEVDGRWIYYRTDPRKSPDSQVTDVRISAIERVRGRAKLDEKVSRFVRVLKEVHPLDVPPAASSFCHKYNKKCEHYDRCFTATQKVALSMKISRGDLLAKLQGAAPSAAVAEPAASPPAVVAAPPPVVAAPVVQQPAPVAAPPPPAAPVQQPATVLPAVDFSLPAAVPETAPPAPPPAVAAAPVVHSPVVQAQTSVAPETELPGPAEKRGRGRPPGSGNKPKEAPKVEVHVHTNGPSLPSKPSVPEATEGAGGRIGVLYINCAPTSGEVLSAAEILSVVQSELERDLGVPHYTLADYGKGRGALFVGVQSLLSGLDIPELALDLASPEARDTLLAFTAVASRIVRGHS
jgi:hypothetical protein